MTDHWKMLCSLAVLVLAITSMPARAGSEGPPSDSQKLDWVLGQLSEMKRSVEDIQRSLARLEAMAGESKVAQTAKELKDKLAQLQKDMEALRNQVPGLARISAYGPGANGTGRLEVRNTYPQEVTVIVNGRAYRVAPGETYVSEPLPAGTVTYQVLEAQRTMQTRTLAPNETLTVHVHLPR